jgi:uncharacterized protein YlxW (UPF0749 family)
MTDEHLDDQPATPGSGGPPAAARTPAVDPRPPAPSAPPHPAEPPSAESPRPAEPSRPVESPSAESPRPAEPSRPIESSRPAESPIDPHELLSPDGPTVRLTAFPRPPGAASPSGGAGPSAGSEPGARFGAPTANATLAGSGTPTEPDASTTPTPSVERTRATDEEPIQGTPAGPGDAGPGDAGPGDAGPGDAGPGDAGPGDAGPGDAGPGRAGRGVPDEPAGGAAPGSAQPVAAGAGEGPVSSGAPAPVTEKKPGNTTQAGTAGTPVAERTTRKITSAGALIWVLLALLGFTLVVQLRSNDGDAGLATARQEDLVGILSDLEARDQRLQQEINALEESQRQLTSGVAGREAALAEADKRAGELGLLAGTLPARGPGLKIEIDPRGQQVKASQILNAVQELRGAGGEVMEIIGANGVAVRIVASSYFVDAGGGEVIVDGKRLRGPYTLWVIGAPSTMQTALQIPGGVVASVTQAGGNVTMEQRSTVEVTAVRQPTSLQYARPVS